MTCKGLHSASGRDTEEKKEELGRVMRKRRKGEKIFLSNCESDCVFENPNHIHVTEEYISNNEFQLRLTL